MIQVKHFNFICVQPSEALYSHCRNLVVLQGPGCVPHKFPTEFNLSISMQIPEIGDCIGVESSADLKLDVYTPPRRRGSRRMEAAAEKQYPPPILWLTQTEDHQSHMPWVMKKYYTDNGRLVIREERVKHHEYFLTDRSNGRLALNLVHLDDAVEEEDSAVVDQFPGEGIDDGNAEINDPVGEKVVAECYKYNGMGVKPCGGFVTAAAAGAAVMFRSPVPI